MKNYCKACNKQRRITEVRTSESVYEKCATCGSTLSYRKVFDMKERSNKLF